MFPAFVIIGQFWSSAKPLLDEKGSVLSYAPEVGGLFVFLLALPGAWASARKWTQEHRGRRYRPHPSPRRHRLTRRRPNIGLSPGQVPPAGILVRYLHHRLPGELERLRDVGATPAEFPIDRQADRGLVQLSRQVTPKVALDRAPSPQAARRGRVRRSM